MHPYSKEGAERPPLSLFGFRPSAFLGERRALSASTLSFEKGDSHAYAAISSRKYLWVCFAAESLKVLLCSVDDVSDNLSDSTSASMHVIPWVALKFYQMYDSIRLRRDSAHPHLTLCPSII
jgi:succinate-acetate transporter protein